MDALAESWFRSGERDENLYKGNTEKIIRELKAWIIARKTRNEANIKLLWDLFETDDAISRLRDQYGTIEDPRIAPFKAKRVKNVDRVKEFKEERDKLNLRAEFLINTLSHRGFEWFVMPFTPQWTDLDSEVCSFLKMHDRNFDGERQLKILEMEDEVAEWRLEHARRETEEAARRLEGTKAIANYDVPTPINVTGLLPRPRLHTTDTPTGTPTDRLSPVPMDTIEEEPAETEEAAEVIARRINSTNTARKQVKVERRSKTMIRNAERRKARVRTREATRAEAAEAEALTDGGGGGLMDTNDG